MSENYIMLNGKRVDLTDDQLEKLGLKIEKDCFKRLERGKKFYCIGVNGKVEEVTETLHKVDDACYNVANYCTNEKLMWQRALHETLSRLLWRFSMQNDGDKIDWNDNCKYIVLYDHECQKFRIDRWTSYHFQGSVYFYKEKIAQRAIDEIILPFMKEYPEFVW